MKIKVETCPPKEMYGVVENDVVVPGWVAFGEDCSVCWKGIKSEESAVVARLEFPAGFGQRRFFHKDCFYNNLKPIRTKSKNRNPKRKK